MLGHPECSQCHFPIDSLLVHILVAITQYMVSSIASLYKHSVAAMVVGCACVCLALECQAFNRALRVTLALVTKN